MNRFLRSTILVAALLSTPARADITPTVRYSLDAEAGRPLETALAADGRVAWTTKGGAGHQLFIDGREVAAAKGIEQIQWTRGGDLAYCTASVRGLRIHWGDHEGRLWDEIRTPDLAALAQANDPAHWSWMDRGGASMAFAARDPRDPDSWVRLTRRPSQPVDLERRALTTTRTVRDDPDPAGSRTFANRYHLVAGHVPAYIGRRKTEECLVVGTREMACGVRIEMIAVAPGTERNLVAWRAREGGDLLLSDGLQTTGPWRRIDWASFSSDGLRYAVMVVDREGERIQTDRGTTLSIGRLAALAHLADGALAALWFLEDRAVLLADDRVVMEGAIVTRFLRPPSGDPVPVVRDDEGYRLGADPRATRARQIWGEGFLANGAHIAQMTPLDGGQGLIVGGALQMKGDALTWVLPSPSAARILTAVQDRETARSSVLLDGVLLREVDELTALGFVGDGAAARPWVQGRDQGNDCLWTSLFTEGLCCPSSLGWTGGPAAPVLLCADPAAPTVISADGVVEAVDSLPPAFVLVGRDGRVLWYATRSGNAWRLHGADGRTAPLPGEPLLLLPGPDAGDHPRLLLSTDAGKGWFSGNDDARFDAEVADMPHEIRGLGPVYAARSGGTVRWVGPAFVTTAADAFGSAPHLTRDGVSWWELRDGRWHWVTVSYDVLN